MEQALNTDEDIDGVVEFMVAFMGVCR